MVNSEWPENELTKDTIPLHVQEKQRRGGQRNAGEGEW